MRHAASTFTLLVSLSAFAAERPVTVQQGERRQVSIGTALGVVVDRPEVLEVQLLGGGRLEVLGRAPGSARVELWEANGTRSKRALVVQVRKGKGSPVAEASPWNQTWEQSKFGGVKVENAHCTLPFEQRANEQLFDRARLDLQRQEPKAAIEKLDALAKAEPDSVTTHLYLGAALASLKEPNQAAAFYETFVLSCVQDPRTPKVIAILAALEKQR